MTQSGTIRFSVRRFAAALAAPLCAAACPAVLADSVDFVFADGFELACPGTSEGVTLGSGSALLLRGTVVTPTIAFVGEVLVQGDTITCAAVSCAGQPAASTASIVETRGMIFPGMIDSQNHVLFDIFDENDWAPTQVYANFSGVTNDPRYKALIDAKQYLNGETSPVDLGCEMDKYGELKALLAGTTSTTGYAGSPDRVCYGSLTRTIDSIRNDLGPDYVQVNTIFPDRSTADSVCANYANDKTHAYEVNVGEGTSGSALTEFAKLGTISTVANCLYVPQTAIGHGTALVDSELTTMATHNMSLVWMPHSDVALYAQTANVPLAMSKGINVSLATNWSIVGSHNLLAELRYADQVDNTTWGNVLSPYDLAQMVTINAAKTLHLDASLGSIEVGKRADLTVIGGTCSNPWWSLLNARSRDVRMVMVGGIALYGDTPLQPTAPSTPGCEALDVCGASKFVCVAESGGTASNKFGQTLGDISASLSSALANFDAMNLTQWKFSPLTPLMDCR